jgi:hypothetical protein
MEKGTRDKETARRRWRETKTRRGSNYASVVSGPLLKERSYYENEGHHGEDWFRKIAGLSISRRYSRSYLGNSNQIGLATTGYRRETTYKVRR